MNSFCQNIEPGQIIILIHNPSLCQDFTFLGFTGQKLSHELFFSNLETYTFMTKYFGKAKLKQIGAFQSWNHRFVNLFSWIRASGCLLEGHINGLTGSEPLAVRPGNHKILEWLIWLVNNIINQIINESSVLSPWSSSNHPAKPCS